MAQALVSVHLVPAFVIVFTGLWPRESGGGHAVTASRASDDILFACKPEYENFVRKLQEAFQVEDSKVSEGNFRFCGREISQDDDGSIIVTCKSTAEKIEPISYRTGVPKTQLANDAEKAQLRSVVGSLAWVARQARPD